MPTAFFHKQRNITDQVCLALGSLQRRSSPCFLLAYDREDIQYDN